MESLGALLKDAREKKACSFEQVSRDTNIARRYLEALEAENFSVFPGEPYLLGFLRNYADYLGLEAPFMIDLYRNMKIQEEPVPVEALLKKPFPVKGLVKGLAIGASIVVVVLLMALLIPRLGKGPEQTRAPGGDASSGAASSGDASPETRASATPNGRSPVRHVLESGYIEKRLYPGDETLVRFGDGEHRLAIADLNDLVVLSTPSGELRIELGQEEAIDLNGDGHGDVIVFVADLYKNRPEKGASVRFELVSADATPIPAAIATPLASEVKPAEAGTTGPATTAATASVDPAAAVAAASAAGANVLFTSPGTAWPFTIQATFRGYCMFRWEVDRKDREERYFHKAETLTVQARNGLRLWISNAAAVKLTAIGGGRSVDLDIGRAGEVVVVDVKWVRNEDNQYRLITERVD